MEAILQQLIWLCYSMWLFYLHSVLKIQPFSVFSQHCGNETTTNYNRALIILGSVIAHGCFVSTIY